MSYPATFNEGRLEVEGIAVRYREAGSGDPVVVLDGWPWRFPALQEALAGSYRVLEIEIPGGVAADTAGPSNLSYITGRAASSLVEGPYTLIGTSVGASAALWQTLLYPGRGINPGPHFTHGVAARWVWIFGHRRRIRPFPSGGVPGGRLPSGRNRRSPSFARRATTTGWSRGWGKYHAQPWRYSAKKTGWWPPRRPVSTGRKSPTATSPSFTTRGTSLRRSARRRSLVVQLL